MTAIERTAYPRFKRSLTAKDLAEIYTPTPAERFLAARSTKGSVAEVGFLVLLKTFQRLGRFLPLSEVPVPILEHIAKLIDPSLDVSELDGYDSSGTRQRHIPLIRAAQQLKPYSPVARTCLLKAMFEAAKTKEDLADLINVALEELAKECFELPPFATLDKAAHHVRAMTMRGLYHWISQAIPQEARAALDALFVVEDGTRLSGWEQLKQEPASPTLTHLRDLIDHLFVISEQRKRLPPRLFEGLAEGKVKQLATEARALDATEMKDLEPHKRLTLAATFVLVQSAGALDDLAEMFIKRMLAIHQKGKDALERYRVEHKARTDALVLTLHDLVTAYGKEGTSEERIVAMESVIGDRAAKILQDCDFNGFAKWAFFGGEGVITHNRRAEQRKCIKFNHLIANCLIFYNVQVISDILYQLNQEGIELDEQVVAALSPYVCQHINRFGRYQLDLTQSPPPLNYDLQVITKRSKKRITTNMVAAISPKKAKPKRKKKNTARQMKLL